MRLNKPLTILACIFALAIFESHSHAQSGSRGAVSSVIQNAQSLATPFQTGATNLTTQFQNGSLQGAAGLANQFQAAPVQGVPFQNAQAPIQNAIQSAIPQNVPFQNAPVISSPGFSTGQSVLNSPVYSSVVGAAPAQNINSNVYSPTTIGEFNSGPRCCDLTPTPIAVPPVRPVGSCCGTMGKLGVPSLLTPIRYDTPPIGKAVGRPLFGRWTGF